MPRRVLFSVCLLLVAAGCDHHLETGYKYRPLSASPDDRAGYYAPAFTPESNPDNKKADKGSSAGP